MTPRKARLFYGYIVVAAAFVIAAVGDGLLYSFGVFFESLLNEFGWSRAMTSGAFAMSFLIRIPFIFIAGTLSDRLGPRPTLSACGFFLGLGYILLSQTVVFWQIYLFYGVVVAVGTGLFWVPLMSIVPKWFVKRRATMISVVASGIGLGQLTYPVLAARLISIYDWRTAFLIMGALSMFLVMTSAQFLRKSPAQTGLLPYGASGNQKESEAKGLGGLTAKEASRTGQFWVFSAVFFCWIFCLGVVVAHLVIHARGLGMTPSSAASLIGVIGISGIIGRLTLGRLADSRGIKPVVLLSLTLMLADFIWILIARDPWMLYPFAVIFGVSYGIFEMLESPMVASLFGMRSLGAIFSAAFVIASVGFFSGPIIAGYIYDVKQSYSLAFATCIVLSLTGVVLTVLLPIGKERG